LSSPYTYQVDQTFLWGVVIILFTSYSCTNNQIHHTEVNQVFKVLNTPSGFEAGDLIYKDSIIYQNKYLPSAKYIFNNQNVLTGVERYPSLSPSQTSVQSIFETTDGEPLSYYKYILNDRKLKERVEAYDATNNELLRYELLEYNDNNQLSIRKIFTSDGHLASSYSLIYDMYGNELRKITQHMLRDTIITEESRITKYTEEKDWTEKWGFVNDKPVALYKKLRIE